MPYVAVFLYIECLRFIISQKEKSKHFRALDIVVIYDLLSVS